jgi:hypothetical protein
VFGQNCPYEGYLVRFAVIAAVLLLAAGSCIMIACSGSPNATTQHQPPTPPGPVVATTTPCPGSGLPGTSCYALDITCPGIPNYTAYVKIIAPATPVGTVIFTTGGAGTTLYEASTSAPPALNAVFKAGYEVVELTFGAPFSTEPGWQHDVNGLGVRAAACRYAMVVQWLSQQTPSVPLCATGNSAGGALIGEGLAHYSLGSYLTFAEITSGPPFSDVNQACDPSVPPAVEYCSNANTGTFVGVSDATNYIDPAYPGPWCSQYSTQNQQQFQNDSITSSDAVLNYPNTNVRFIFGGLDTSSAIRNGLAYHDQITSSKSVGCVLDAPHDIPEVLDGAQMVASDLIANCHK